MGILKTVLVVIEALFALNLLIFVHELGHFLAARWRGMKVERFAIWFGKPIWSKKIGGVEYALGWIPAGGYVSLPQMASMEAIEGKTENTAAQLPSARPLDKIIVAVAGPLFSFLLAVVFAAIVWLVGRPVPQGGDKPVLGWVVPEGPAWNAGLRPGDTIVSIDGHAIKTYGPPSQDSVLWRVITSEGTNIVVTYSRDGQEKTVHISPIKLETKWYERRSMRKILVDSPFPAVVGAVLTNSPAALAGLKEGDEIIAINGEKVYSISAIRHVQGQMTNSECKPAIFTIKRGTEEFERAILAEKPAKPTNAPALFGIAWQDITNRTLIHPSPSEQIESACGQIFGTISAVFSSKTEIGPQHLGGPVMIIRVYKTLFEDDEGWRLVLWFSVVLNVNLALLNMLPLPVLDGGHILLSLIEAVRRRAASPKILNYIQSGFAVLLISFMVWIVFLDSGDWIRSAWQNRSEEIIFAPKK
jgi:regulator of sigma E protease